MLAGAAIGLVLHFARDIVEGPPGVRMLWPLQQTAWIASHEWFLAMIIAFTAVRLVLVSAGLPRGRVRLFEAPSRSRSIVHIPAGRVTSGDRFPGPEPDEPDFENASGMR